MGSKYGCPYLTNDAVWVGFNDLATTHPEVAAQWHPTKNGNLTPEMVTAGSNQLAWWLFTLYRSFDRQNTLILNGYGQLHWKSDRWMSALIQPAMRSGQDTMICGPVSQILRNNGLRKTVSWIQTEYTNFRKWKPGGNVWYAVLNGGLQWTAELPEVQVVRNVLQIRENFYIHINKQTWKKRPYGLVFFS